MAVTFWLQHVDKAGRQLTSSVGLFGRWHAEEAGFVYDDKITMTALHDFYPGDAVGVVGWFGKRLPSRLFHHNVPVVAGDSVIIAAGEFVLDVGGE